MDEFSEFSNKINETARWYKWEYVVEKVLVFTYFPLS